MNTNVEQLENSQVQLTVEVGKEQVSVAINKAYNSMKKDFNLQGFRKGKVPRPVIEKMYGVEIFFNNAIDYIIDDTLGKAIDEHSIEIVARLREGDLKVENMSVEAMKYVAVIAVKPEVTLGEYKNLKIEVESAEVTDEDVDTAIEQEAAKNAREVKVEGRGVQPQDKVTIDFEGFVGDEAFEGGKGEDYPLVIGSGSFIPGFEEQLIGKNIGDDVDVNVSFPEEYHAPDLAGKPALFKVKVKDIEVTELPEIDDDFAADVSEFDTLAEYKEDLKASLAKEKEEAVKNETTNDAIEQAVKNATFVIPDAMIEEEIDKQISQFSNNIKRQGLELEQYFQFTGTNLEEFKENFREGAVAQIGGRLVLEAVANQENIEISQEEIDGEFAEMANQYKMPLEQVKMAMGGNIEPFVQELKVKKAIEIITDSIEVIEK